MAFPYQETHALLCPRLRNGIHCELPAGHSGPHHNFMGSWQATPAQDAELGPDEFPPGYTWKDEACLAVERQRDTLAAVLTKCVAILRVGGHLDCDPLMVEAAAALADAAPYYDGTPELADAAERHQAEEMAYHSEPAGAPDRRGGVLSGAHAPRRGSPPQGRPVGRWAVNRAAGEHLRLLSYGVGPEAKTVFVDPATVTSIFPAGLPGVSRIHHNGSVSGGPMLDLVNGAPEDVFEALYGARP